MVKLDTARHAANMLGIRGGKSTKVGFRGGKDIFPIPPRAGADLFTDTPGLLAKKPKRNRGSTLDKPQAPGPRPFFGQLPSASDAPTVRVQNAISQLLQPRFDMPINLDSPRGAGVMNRDVPSVKASSPSLPHAHIQTRVRVHSHAQARA